MSPATIELTAPDISCAKCKANIEGDLAGEPGDEPDLREPGNEPAMSPLPHRVTGQSGVAYPARGGPFPGRDPAARGVRRPALGAGA